jgi:hypothetical protein
VHCGGDSELCKFEYEKERARERGLGGLMSAIIDHAVARYESGCGEKAYCCEGMSTWNSILCTALTSYPVHRSRE